MENLFTTSATEKIIDRIGKLTENSKPLWGKMNVGQMLAHCQVPLQVGIGEAKLKRTLIGILFGSIAKRALLKEKPFSKNLPTDKSFIVADSRLVEAEKANLINLINRFTATDSGAFEQANHPFFGKMTADEWGILSWKHLDHHLLQFGV